MGVEKEAGQLSLQLLKIKQWKKRDTTINPIRPVDVQAVLPSVKMILYEIQGKTQSQMNLFLVPLPDSHIFGNLKKKRAFNIKKNHFVFSIKMDQRWLLKAYHYSHSFVSVCSINKIFHSGSNLLVFTQASILLWIWLDWLKNIRVSLWLPFLIWKLITVIFGNACFIFLFFSLYVLNNILSTEYNVETHLPYVHSEKKKKLSQPEATFRQKHVLVGAEKQSALDTKQKKDQRERC